MPLFKRGKNPAASKENQRAAIDGFWNWWATQGAAETASAIADEVPARMVDALSRRVKAIHGDLAWELAPGISSQHVLVVTSEGNATIRGAARRWRLAAPPSDPVWEYSDTRRAVAEFDGIVLELGPLRVDAASARVTLVERGSSIDVTMRHPTFAGGNDQLLGTATFLLLDVVLGEKSVETWVGSVAWSPTMSPDATTLADSNFNASRMLTPMRRANRRGSSSTCRVEESPPASPARRCPYDQPLRRTSTPTSASRCRTPT